MHITFSPIRADARLSATKIGDVVTINGDAFDFAGLPEGGEIEVGGVPCEWIIGPVQRIGGKIHLTLRLPLGPNPSYAVAFPATLIDPPNGILAIPHDQEA